MFASYVIVLLKRILTTVVRCHVTLCYLEKCTEASKKSVFLLLSEQVGHQQSSSI
jgi:hypothetical protein